MNTPSKTELLAQIAQIQRMERGKLSPCKFRDRPPTATPHFKLQVWKEGKNVTRHVRAEQVPLVEEALAGYARFQDLVEQYAQVVLAQTREELAGVGVKKKPGPRPNSAWRKKPKSSN